MISVGVVWWYIIWCEFSMWVWYGVDDKKYDFDRVVLFVDLVWLKSIDFTGVFNDFWTVNRCAFMNYFFVKYGIFGGVRLKYWFIRV